MTWLEDKNGNKCSVEYFNTRERAQEALDSLKDCENCINCSRCSDCSGCSDCSRCYGCSRCSDCSGCSRCSGCSGAENKKENEGTFKPPAVQIIPDIHKQVYTAASQPKSLEMSDWHTCEKTHCRGGWVVTLAGAEGKALEKFYGTLLAAMLIYDASDPEYKINPGRFFDSNEKALEDMRKLAEK